MTQGSPGCDDLERLVRQGDKQALAELFAMHQRRLCRMVHFRMDPRLRGRVDPEDVVQEGYLAAAQRIDHYCQKTEMSPFVWLRLIVGQTLIDAHRHHLGTQLRDAGREVSIDAGYQARNTSTMIALQIVAPGTTPSNAVARAQTVEQVEKAIAEMDPIDQEVLALRHFEELSNREVAEVLGIEQKAASIRYVRALRRLKGILAQIPGFLQEGDHA